MKSSWKKALVLVAAVALCLTANDVMAQGRRNNNNAGGGGAGGGAGAGGGGGRRNGGNFDPAAARQRQMDNYKDRLEVTDDAEWKVLEAAIGKVLDAQQELRTANFGGGGRGGRGGRGGNTNNTGDTTNTPAGGGAGGGGGRGGFGPTMSSEMQALQMAIDNKASADEIKDRLAKVRESVKAKEAKLDGAQKELQRLLSARQEGTAVLMGLLK